MVAGASALFACNLSGGASVTIDITDDAGVADEEPADAYPAPHPPLPQVTSGGGPVVQAPVFVPVIFGDDGSAADIIAFNSAIVASSYWSTLAGEYGVGPATAGTPIVVPAAQFPMGIGAMLDDDAIETWLQAQVAAGGLLAGAAGDAGTIYAVYLPDGTTATHGSADGDSLTSCVGFGGYHSSFTIAGTMQNIVYVVVPRCATLTPLQGPPLTGVDAITGPASHEYLEAATDPLGNGYGQTDYPDFVWNLTLGGEIADLCLYGVSPYTNVAAVPSKVQRAWSNAAAAAGEDPCVPAPPGEVFFSSVGELPNQNVDLGETTLATNAIALDVGQTSTVTVDLFSQGPTTSRWNVRAVDTSALTGGPPYLSFAWEETDASTATGQNGDKLHLGVTMIAPPPTIADGFLLVSGMGVGDGGAVGSSWMGLAFEPLSN